MYVSQHVFLSFHSVLMFRFASSIKENGNWLSKTTLEEVGCRSDADSIYPESHFWVVAAGAGRYSCPVATMFCEKLLTRRDIAENLRASVIGIRLSFCVVGIKRCLKPQRDVWEKYRQQLTPCKHTVWRETHHQKSFYLLWKLLFKYENLTFFCWHFHLNYFTRFLIFERVGGNSQFPNARALASLPGCVFGLVWHRTLWRNNSGEET